MKWKCAEENYPIDDFYKNIMDLHSVLQDIMFVIKVKNLTYIASFETIDKLPIDIEQEANQILIWVKIE